MNEAPLAIRAVYANWRVVKTRGVLVLEFEVPIEEQEEVLKVLGAPLFSQAQWVGITLMHAPGKKESEDKPEKRTWDELLPSAQAAMRCQEPAFQDWLAKRMGRVPFKHADEVARKDVTNQRLKEELHITSKRELHSNPIKNMLWNALDTEYQTDMGLLPEER